MKVGLVVPHIFMHRDILPSVIFSPGSLALDLANGLQKQGIEVTLFTPGPVETAAKNVTADLQLFERELALRGDTYLDLLKKHPFTFVTLARQIQSEIIAAAFSAANQHELDLVHVYTNEEDTALPFAKLCQKPVLFTHHDPFNFLIKYKNVFPKYPQLNWTSLSYAQRAGMPPDTRWVGNVYHGLDSNALTPNYKPAGNYVAYLGRIVEPKGLHIAIEAVNRYNSRKPAEEQLTLKIAGKHYAGHQKDEYWKQHIEPQLDGTIEYVGFIKDNQAKQDFLGNAKALVVPSIFEEPFGMVVVEALACGTPVIGLDSGALPELIKDERGGIIVEKKWTQQLNPKTGKLQRIVDSAKTATAFTDALEIINSYSRHACRQLFEDRFTLDRMCQEHAKLYQTIQATSK